MRTLHLAPDDTEIRHLSLGTLCRTLCLVDVCDALAQIEFGLLGRVHTFDLDERSFVHDGAQTPLEGDEHTAGVQPAEPSER